MTNIAVLKFGGSSVKSAARINHVAGIIANNPAQKQIVVLSAMGDTTDYLLKLAKQCAPAPDKRELDLLLSSGEQVSTSLLAIKLRALGINARAFTGQQLGICTDACHTEARITSIDKPKLLAILNKCDVVVAAGFQGINSLGDITTLGRGGSDTTAVAIAASIGAESCQIFTDVDGIYTADPRLFKNAILRKRISYEEAGLLAHAGAQVIHPRAVELASQYSLKIRVQNTFQPGETGTTIGKDIDMETEPVVYNVAIGQKEACIKLKNICGNFQTVSCLSNLISSLDITLQSVSESISDDVGKKSIEVYASYSDDKLLLAAVKELEIASGANQTDIDLELVNISIIGKALTKNIVGRLLNILKEANITPRKIELSNHRISCLVENIQSTMASTLLHDALNNCFVDNNQSAA